MNKAENLPQLSVWIEGAIIPCLFVFAVFAPHSIAVTQSAWLIGMVLWVARFFVFPRPEIKRTPVDYTLLGFFIITGLSAFLSYEPLVSIGKLRGASLFTIVYLFFQNVPSRRVARLLAATLIASCMVNVVYTAATRIVGRGIKLQTVSANSPLSSGVWFTQGKRPPFPVVGGDTVLEVDGQRLHNLEQLAAALDAARDSTPARVKIYRAEFTPTLNVPRGQLLPGVTPEERLGIAGWSTSRDWRATGFYSLWVTYSEALQLITSLALGLFIALPLKRSRTGALLVMALSGLALALLLAVTRASWLGLLVSATVMVLFGTSRRTILILAACLIPLVLAGLFVLQQQRRVGFVDRQDASITWRETVWREGFDLLISKPRHLLIGVGMDSLKAHWREWGLFDQGRLPVGHMHSNFLQIALERGIPALIVWLVLLGVYARTLWRLTRRLGKSLRPAKEAGATLGDWADRGIVLGALGGLAGFFTSGLVHYNWGDSTVMMIFYFIMALSLIIERETNAVNVG